MRYNTYYTTTTLGGYSDQKYDFTGKERDTETGLHYYGARYYDSELGVWLQVDPLADKYPGWSPYNYCVNNPVRNVDPDGREVVFKDEEIKKQHEAFYGAKDKDGNFVNTKYREQYDKLHSSDVVYNVVAGELGSQGNATVMGNFGTTDGQTVTITLNMEKGANIGEDLSHEFQHGIQFERGEIIFRRETTQDAWSSVGSCQSYELEAFANQQQKPIWWGTASKNQEIIEKLYPGLPTNSEIAVDQSENRVVSRYPLYFGISVKK